MIIRIAAMSLTVMSLALSGCTKKADQSAPGETKDLGEQPAPTGEGGKPNDEFVPAVDDGKTEGNEAAALVEETPPSISYGPKASKENERLLRCQYTAMGFSGGIKVSLAWEMKDGAEWKAVGSEDYLPLKDEQMGKDARCRVSVTDGKGKSASKTSDSVR